MAVCHAGLEEGFDNWSWLRAQSGGTEALPFDVIDLTPTTISRSRIAQYQTQCMRRSFC